MFTTTFPVNISKNLSTRQYGTIFHIMLVETPAPLEKLDLLLKQVEECYKTKKWDESKKTIESILQIFYKKIFPDNPFESKHKEKKIARFIQISEENIGEKLLLKQIREKELNRLIQEEIKQCEKDLDRMLIAYKQEDGLIKILVKDNTNPISQEKCHTSVENYKLWRRYQKYQELATAYFSWYIFFIPILIGCLYLLKAWYIKQYFLVKNQERLRPWESAEVQQALFARQVYGTKLCSFQNNYISFKRFKEKQRSKTLKEQLRIYSNLHQASAAYAQKYLHEHFRDFLPQNNFAFLVYQDKKGFVRLDYTQMIKQGSCPKDPEAMLEVRTEIKENRITMIGKKMPYSKNGSLAPLRNFLQLPKKNIF